MTLTSKPWYPSKEKLDLRSIRIRTYPIHPSQSQLTPSADATYSLNDPESWEIIKLLQDFARVVKRAAENYDPSLIAKYAINLAQAFNKYYAHTRILDESPRTR